MGRNISSLNLIANTRMLILTIRMRILELLGRVIKKMAMMDLKLSDSLDKKRISRKSE